MQHVRVRGRGVSGRERTPDGIPHPLGAPGCARTAPAPPSGHKHSCGMRKGARAAAGPPPTATPPKAPSPRRHFNKDGFRGGVPAEWDRMRLI